MGNLKVGDIVRWKTAYSYLNGKYDRAMRIYALDVYTDPTDNMAYLETLENKLKIGGFFEWRLEPDPFMTAVAKALKDESKT